MLRGDGDGDGDGLSIHSAFFNIDAAFKHGVGKKGSLCSLSFRKETILGEGSSRDSVSPFDLAFNMR